MFGVWCLVFDARCLVFGVWCFDVLVFRCSGASLIVCVGVCCLGFGVRCSLCVFVCWLLVVGCFLFVVCCLLFVDG